MPDLGKRINRTYRVSFDLHVNGFERDAFGDSIDEYTFDSIFDAINQYSVGNLTRLSVTQCGTSDE